MVCILITLFCVDGFHDFLISTLNCLTCPTFPGEGAGPVDYATVVCMEPGCGESFQDLTQLRAHKKISHRYVACEVCGLSMLKRQLKMHNFQHEGEAPCIRCPYPGCLHSYTQVCLLLLLCIRGHFVHLLYFDIHFISSESSVTKYCV